MSQTFRSFRNANFRWFAAASLLANTAMWMQRIAQDWLTVKAGGDGLAVGLTTALQFLPILLISPFAGALADRFSKRALLSVTGLVMAAPAALMALDIALGRTALWHIYVFALALGVGSAIDTPARSAYVRELIADDDLINAIGLSAVVFHTSRILGPAAAGLLIGGLGAPAAFLAVAMAYGVSTLVLRRARQASSAPLEQTRPKAGLGEALRELRRQPPLIAVMLLAAAVSSFSLNFQITTTLMATRVFALDAAQFGRLTAMMAVGSIGGALIVARLARPTYALVFLSASLLGAAYLVAVGARTPLLFGCALVPIGLLSNLYLASSNAIVQVRVDRQMQGRIAGLYQSGSYALVPLGALTIGRCADLWSPRAPLAVAGVLGVIGGLVALGALLTTGAIRWTGQRFVEPDLT